MTGPLWARKAWGVWWVWDPRLTSSLLLFLIFAAYLMLRQYGGPGSDQLAAGMALFGMANVPFIYVSVNVWRTFHPMTSVVPTLPTDMGIPLWFCFAAFTMLFVALLTPARARSNSSAPASKRFICRGRSMMRLLRIALAAWSAARPSGARRGVAAAAAAAAEEFVPVDDVPPGEQIPAIHMVGAAYGFVWVARARLRVVDRAAAAAGRNGAGRSGIAESRWRSAFRPPRTSSSFPAVLLIGVVIGWILGSRAAQDAMARS